ncbi:MAG TPA: transposase [Solirubrobacterales bacterium]|jgi:transposase|nr:transposase [Solirubrobacterales bacterium]HNM20675.1 transposase [Nitrospira sp.]HMX71096.1 transposase [Solirubrobacterales bacterium]HNA44707.1 transposase [Solirubrobacterales bacterium]HNK35730.1 transposase [Solirubrobacterales bacterium]
MPKTRPAYPEEFKLEAVQMVRSGRSAISVAEALGCSPQAIGQWLRKYEVENGIRSDGLNSDEREELKKLRREVIRLKQERDLLKRAAAFFAADQ